MMLHIDVISVHLASEGTLVACICQKLCFVAYIVGLALSNTVVLTSQCCMNCRLKCLGEDSRRLVF